MKRGLLGVSLLAVAELSFAQAAPNSVALSLWLDGALRRTGTATGSDWAIGGSGSGYNSLTFSGRRNLTNGTYGYFLLNYRFLINTGAPNGLSIGAGSDPFWRQSVVGLGKDGVGEVQVGHQIMPLQEVNGAFDPWGNATVATTHSNGIAASIRANNAVYFRSANMNGFTIHAAVAGKTNQFAGEFGSGLLGYNAKTADLTKENPMGMSVRYQTGPLSLGAAVDKNGSGQNTFGMYGSYDFGAAKLFGQFESGENYTSATSTATSPDEKVKAFSTGVRVPLPFGPMTAVAGYTRVTSDLVNRDASKVGVGLEYQMDKDWLIYSNVGKWSGDRMSVAAKKASFDIGMRIKF